MLPFSPEASDGECLTNQEDDGSASPSSKPSGHKVPRTLLATKFHAVVEHAAKPSNIHYPVALPTSRSRLNGCYFDTCRRRAWAGKTPPCQRHGGILSYLTPSPAAWQGKATLPSRPCRTSAGLMEKTYTCKTLSTAAPFQVHQVDLLQRMGSALTEEDVDNLHKATDFAVD